MIENVLIMTFPQNSVAYEAYSKLKTLHSRGQVDLDQLAVIENVAGEGFRTNEAVDLTGSDRLFAGGLIGGLIGIIGGPLGMLLGWTTGAMIGGVGDMREVDEAVTTFDRAASVLTEETVGVLAVGTEYSESVINDLVERDLGGTIVRFPVSVVREEIEEAKKAEKALKKEARRQWIDRKLKKEEKND